MQLSLRHLLPVFATVALALPVNAQWMPPRYEGNQTFLNHADGSDMIVSVFVMAPPADLGATAKSLAANWGPDNGCAQLADQQAEDIGFTNGKSIAQTVGDHRCILMLATGNIRIGNWTGTSTQGAGFGAYGTNSGSISGEYYLDGYVLAIKDGSGNISFGTIAAKREDNSNYLFVNGEQYWD
jgi:hypothetical protein